MKVYISGKIGEEVISDATRKKFARAEEFLRSKNYRTFNPTEDQWQKYLEQVYKRLEEVAAKRDSPTKIPTFYGLAITEEIQVLSYADAIYMMAGWDDSHGCHIELEYAMATGMKIFWESKVDAKFFCDESGNYIGEWLPIEEVEVGVAEPVSKTFKNPNQFEVGASYRRG